MSTEKWLHVQEKAQNNNGISVGSLYNEIAHLKNRIKNSPL